MLFDWNSISIISNNIICFSFTINTIYHYFTFNIMKVKSNALQVINRKTVSLITIFEKTFVLKFIISFECNFFLLDLKNGLILI